MTKDQAEILRGKVESQLTGKQNTESLPSRIEVHGKRRESLKKQKGSKREKRKTTFWATRLLLGAFILLIGITLTYKLWSKDIYIPVHSEDKKGIEEVEIEQ